MVVFAKKILIVEFKAVVNQMELVLFGVDLGEVDSCRGKGGEVE